MTCDLFGDAVQRNHAVPHADGKPKDAEDKYEQQSKADKSRHEFLAQQACSSQHDIPDRSSGTNDQVQIRPLDTARASCVTHFRDAEDRSGR